MKKLEQANTFSFGELNELDANTPGSEAYQNGCEELRGFDILPGRGVKIGRSPDHNAGRAPRYPYVLYEDKKLIRNSNPTDTAIETTTVPSDLPISSIRDLAYYVNQALSSRNYGMAIEAGDTLPEGYKRDDYLESGHASILKAGITPCIPANTVFFVGNTIDIYAAVNNTRGYEIYTQRGKNGLDPDAIQDAKWGLFIQRTGVDILSPSKPRFNCWSFTNSTKPYRKLESGSTQEKFSQSAVSVKLSSGQYYKASADIYLAGKAKAFLGKTGFTIIEDREAWVFEFRTPGLTMGGKSYGEENIPGYVVGNARGWVNPSPKSELQDAWFPAAVDPSVNQGTPGAFLFTDYTFMWRSRRVGAAQFQGVFGVGATGYNGALWDPNNRVVGTGANSPWFTSLDGPVAWIEPAYQGIFVGTEAGEYIITDPYNNPPIVRKISSNGCPAVKAQRPYDILARRSCQFQGTIYYISNFGISTMSYSQEGQTYVPQHFDIRYRRWGNAKLTSLAAALEERCLYLSFDDGQVWKLWPESGGVAQVWLPPKSVLNLTHVFSRNGYAYGLGADGNEYDMTAQQAEESYLRTTAFFRVVDVTARTKRILVRLHESMGGQYRVGGMDDHQKLLDAGEWDADYGSTPLTGIPGWQEFTAGMDTTAMGIPFTGTKEAYVQSLADKEHNGKYVEIRSQVETEIEVTTGDPPVTITTNKIQSRLTIQGIIAEMEG